MPRIGDIAGAMGKGVVAGAAGTALMTASSTIEAKLRDRGSSSAPADAAGKVLGVEPEGEEGEARFGNAVHWLYGSAWGGVRGLFAALGLRGLAGSAAHGAAVWGAAATMLPALDVAPPPTRWGPKEVAIDLWHHAVYAAGTGMAFWFLNRRSSPAAGS